MLKEVSFADGMIEFDLAINGERGFMGGLWRLQDGSNYEDFYIRPHQSGNPDANQYSPIINGASAWQLYHGEGYGKPIEYLTDQWMPIRIVFAGQRADIYIGDLETPAVQVRRLKRKADAGRVGVVNLGDFAHAWFSNFRYSSDAAVAITALADETVDIESGIIKKWSVSDAFPEADLAQHKTLPHAASALAWQDLAAESNGITNLSWVTGSEGDRNSVYARIDIQSETDQSREFRFGYSDRVRVFLNGQLLYTGDNSYRTRDYRYLGTIGLFDSLVLPLRKGENQLWLAVSESFGGWGVQGQIADRSGLQIKP